MKRKDAFFGVHFDFHAMEGQVVGEDYRPDVVAKMLDKVKLEFAQCDTKGHAGLSSYPTKVGTAADEIRHDVVAMWRKLTKERGIPLYAHHSGIYDIKAVEKHPDWAVVMEDGTASKSYVSVFSPFADEYLIPQLKELCLEYGFDGAWIDGECWASYLDYSDYAVAAYKKETGKEPPRRGDADFAAYFDFCRRGFINYVTKYITALKAVNPAFEITSNWLYSAYVPQEMEAPIDFISGDYNPADSVRSARYNSRCIAARGITWDLMAWGQHAIPGSWSTRNRNTKEYAQYCQEAAEVVALGGGFQFFNIMYGNGGTVQEWAIPMWKGVSEFCRERREFCFRAENVSHLTVNGCNFYAIMDDVVAGSGLYDFRFLNNTVKHLGYIGISLEDCGDFPTLKSSEIHIVNNDIGDVGNVRHTYSGAISLRRCVGVTMRHNDLHDCPHLLVNLGEGGSPCVNVVFEYNHVYNAVYECDDSAAVYWGRNANNLGTVISHNYFHDIGNDYTHGHSNAIYCDDYGVMAHIYNNVFYRGAKPDYCKKHHYSTSGCAVYGRANFGWIHNNIFVDNPTSCKLGFGDTTPVYLRLTAGSAIPYLRDTVGAETDFFYCECNRSNGADHMTPLKKAGFFGEVWRAYYKNTIWAPIFDLLSEQTLAEMMAIVEKHCGKYYTKKEMQEKMDLVYIGLYRYTQRKCLLNNRFDGNINISASEWHPEVGKRFKNTGELMYLDNAPVDKDIRSFGNYTADDDKIDGGKSMFVEYGKDFTLTEEGLAYVRKTVPDFKPFDVTCAGKQAEPVKEEDIKLFWMPKHALPPLPLDYLQADEDGKQAFLEEQDQDNSVRLSDLLDIKHPWANLEKKYEVPQMDGNPFFPYEEDQSTELSYDESVFITDRSLKMTLKPGAKFDCSYAHLCAKVVPIAGKPLDLWNYKQLIVDVEHNDRITQAWFLFASHTYGIARRAESVYEGWDRYVFDLDLCINTNVDFTLFFDVPDEPGMTVRVGKIELVEKDGK